MHHVENKYPQLECAPSSYIPSQIIHKVQHLCFPQIHASFSSLARQYSFINLRLKNVNTARDEPINGKPKPLGQCSYQLPLLVDLDASDSNNFCYKYSCLMFICLNLSYSLRAIVPGFVIVPDCLVGYSQYRFLNKSILLINSQIT